MGTTIQKVQKGQPSATGEDPENHEDQTHPSSPSNLFSLEKHLGG